MDISVGGKIVASLSATKQKVIENDISSVEVVTDIERRAAYHVNHKYEQCFKRLFDEWVPKLRANGVTSIPTDETEFANLVFSQPNYKNKFTRHMDSIRQEFNSYLTEKAISPKATQAAFLSDLKTALVADGRAFDYQRELDYATAQGL